MTDEDRMAATRNLESSYLTEDAEGIPVPRTASAALMSIGTYLQLTQPPEGDPRANVHRQQMRALKLVEDALCNTGTPEKQIEIPTRREREREQIVRTEPPARRHQEEGDMRNFITQRQVDRNRSNRASSSQDLGHHSNGDFESGGASCFTWNIRNTRMPKGFKLTAEIIKLMELKTRGCG